MPAAGAYTLFGDSDGAFRVWVDETQVIDKTETQRSEVQGKIKLQKGRPYRIKVEYVHREGKAVGHLSWRGPQFTKRVLLPASN